MKKYNSAYCAAILAEGVALDEMFFASRSDRWWDMFWYYIGLTEAQRIKEHI